MHAQFSRWPLFPAAVLVAAAMSAGSLASAADAPKTGSPTAAKPAAAPAMPTDLFASPVKAEAVTLAPTAIVAIVEGQEIKQSEVNEVVDRFLAANGGRIPAERLAEARGQIGKRALEDLITQSILLHAAEKAKVQVGADDIEKARKNIPIPEGKTLEQALAEQKMTTEKFNTDITRALKITKLIEAQVADAGKATDAQVKEFYDQNKAKFDEPETVTASHILIKTEAGADAKAKDAAKMKAEGIRKELVGGANFAELAKKYSDDPGSKNKGGEYTFPRGQMVKEFEEAAFGQKLNEIGPLVETQFGFHIIKTTARNPPKTMSLEEATANIKKYLENKGKGEIVQKFVADLRAKADVKYPNGKPE